MSDVGNYMRSCGLTVNGERPLTTTIPPVRSEPIKINAKPSVPPAAHDGRDGGVSVIKPSKVTADMLQLARADDLWHFARNLNAMLEYGYCDKCGLTPSGCEREGCANVSATTPAGQPGREERGRAG